ncbi:hypothetical protein V6N13_049851 [Hibiscus sabdariffa]
MARKDRRETYWRRKRHPVPQSLSRPIDKENTTNPRSFRKGPIRKRVVRVVDENNVDILRCSAIGRSLCATTLAKLSRVPIQAWSKHTFKNIVEVWGSLVYIDKDTSAPTSFEQGCILIETDVMNRIEDVVKLVVNRRLYPDRKRHDVFDQVAEIGIEKTPIKTAWVVEESSTTNKLIANKVVRESDGTIVPDSLGDVVHGLKQDHLEVTQRLDLRVIDCSENATDDLLRENRHILAASAEVPTWSWDETVAIVDRVEDGINMGMNIEEMEQNPSMDIEQVERHVCSDRHVHNALLNRASDSEVIEYNGTLRKVRSVSNVVLSFMKPEDWIEAEQKIKKKGRGRPRNNQKGQGVVIGYLSDSDFKN